MRTCAWCEDREYSLEEINSMLDRGELAAQTIGEERALTPIELQHETKLYPLHDEWWHVRCRANWYQGTRHIGSEDALELATDDLG
jgi:hypothetical protein